MVTRRDLLKAGAVTSVLPSRAGRAFADMPAPTIAEILADNPARLYGSASA